MTLTPTTLLIVLLGALVGGGVVLLVRSLVGFPVDDRVADAGESLAARLQAAGRQVPFAIGAFLLVLLVTRWVVVAVACALLVLFWNRLFGGAREARQGIARLEGLAAWTESLRDTVAGAVGLEQAIPATSYAASPAIRADLTALADRLRVRMPLPEALKRFAEEVDDAGADLIIAALILNSRLRGPGLRDVLTSLARSARLELEMRQRIYASRASTRRSVTIVIGVTVGVRGRPPGVQPGLRRSVRHAVRPDRAGGHHRDLRGRGDVAPQPGEGRHPRTVPPLPVDGGGAMTLTLVMLAGAVVGAGVLMAAWLVAQPVDLGPGRARTARRPAGPRSPRGVADRRPPACRGVAADAALRRADRRRAGEPGLPAAARRWSSTSAWSVSRGRCSSPAPRPARCSAPCCRTPS